MTKTIARPPQPTSPWRQLLGPGYQFSITNERVLRLCPQQRKESTSR